MTEPDSGPQFPARIGLGTWMMGAAAHRRGDVDAVRHALDVGYRLLDTAEMYADGGAEQVIGTALEGFGRARRAELYIVSKVLPDNASRAGTVRACEASIKRMRCEYLDLYLLHWPGPHEFSDTLQGFGELLRRGLIRRFGVSNLDIDDLQRWVRVERRLDDSARAVCNQLYYCLEARGIEFDLLPWQRANQMATMAYSPLGRGELARHPVLVEMGRARDASAAQLALAWCLRQPDVVAIPKSTHAQRIDENLRAMELALTPAELAALDRAFPPPRSKQPLDTI